MLTLTHFAIESVRDFLSVTFPIEKTLDRPRDNRVHLEAAVTFIRAGQWARVFGVQGRHWVDASVPRDNRAHHPGRSTMIDLCRDKPPGSWVQMRRRFQQCRLCSAAGEMAQEVSEDAS